MNAPVHPTDAPRARTTEHDRGPRRESSLAEARRRSRLIASLRRLFTAMAGASFASIFVSMGVFAAQGGFSGADDVHAQPLQMINPRFTGRSKDGVAYQITADVAMRGAEGERVLRLASPVYRDAAGAAVIAPRGIYDEAANEVRLNDGVVFTDKSGNRFTTPSVRIDVNTGEVHGEKGVTGAGPLGVMRGESYELRQSDRAVVLRGGVRGVLPARERGGGAAPSAATAAAPDRGAKE
jgi:lipopolysaccharide export system protein LptC